MTQKETALLPEQASIIAIDNDENNLLVVADLLRLLGVKQVGTGASGKEGLRIAEGLEQVDLILLDIHLPYEDGYAVLKDIRAHPTLRATRVVALTADVMPQHEARARAAGFDGFIGKPIDFDRFPHQIRAILQGQAIWHPR